MRIMTILGSPRRHGNTAKVLGWIEEQFQADGHEVDSANILDYRVQGCGECMACKKGTVELCSIGDDANGLYRRMVAADLVLIAAPVFCWGFPAQIKGLIDRMFCMMDFDGERPDAPRLHGKSDGPFAYRGRRGGRITRTWSFAGFQQLVQWLKGRMAGHWFVGGCTKPEAIGEDVKALAVAFARVLTKAAC